MVGKTTTKMLIKETICPLYVLTLCHEKKKTEKKNTVTGTELNRRNMNRLEAS